MSLTNAANYLASHGRNGDSMLVHMSPGEVNNLNAFAQQHGTEMTINPVTGLPEAFKLRSLLRAAAPVILGAAIPGLGALAGMQISAGLSGALVGGLSTLREMKVNNQKFGSALMQGFMDGAAAWGGANMANAWNKLGAEASGQVTSQGAASGTPNSVAAPGPSGTTPAVGTVPSPPAYSAPVGAASDFSAAAQFNNVVSPATSTAPTVSLAPSSSTANPLVGSTAPIPGNSPIAVSSAASSPYGLLPGVSSSVAPSTVASASPAQSTLSYAFQNPDRIIPALGGGQRAAYTVGAAGLPFAQMAIEESQKDMGLPSAEQAKYKGYRYSKANIGRTRRKVAPYVPGVAMPEQRYFDYQTDYGPLEEYTAAAGGLMDAHNSLGSYSDGGRLLRGPGDGVSDDIPAQIDGDQPAKLADGEFVIPARDVAELGNGSTDAGARKLYAMLDRLEKSRRMAKRGQDMRPERHLPA